MKTHEGRPDDWCVDPITKRCARRSPTSLLSFQRPFERFGEPSLPERVGAAAPALDIGDSLLGVGNSSPAEKAKYPISNKEYPRRKDRIPARGGHIAGAPDFFPGSTRALACWGWRPADPSSLDGRLRHSFLHHVILRVGEDSIEFGQRGHGALLVAGELLRADGVGVFLHVGAVLGLPSGPPAPRRT